MLKRSAMKLSTSFSVGSKIPSLNLHFGFPPEMVNVAERTAGKKTVPSYLENQAELKSRGIDEVLCYCVNDGAVMSAWAKNLKIEGSNLTFLGDPTSEFTQAIDMVLDAPGAMAVLGNKRSKRFAMYIEDGVVKVFNVSEGNDDVHLSCAEGIMKDIDNLQK